MYALFLSFLDFESEIPFTGVFFIPVLYQQDQFPEQLQDEAFHHRWCGPHDVRALSGSRQPHVCCTKFFFFFLLLHTTFFFSTAYFFFALQMSCKFSCFG